MKKHYKIIKITVLCTIALASFTIDASAQNVNIPDANFKAYLVANSAINTNADADIQVSEATSFTGNIFGNNLGITDLTGIEAFTSLTGLYCRDNNLGSIDVSANTALTYLDCQNTNISTLNINTNTALTGIGCPMNNLTSLNVSNNTALTAINCSNNNITSLDVSNNVLLSNFSCDNNALTSLNVSNNTALIYFVCHFNNLTSLDVSNSTALSYLACSGNNISSLDLSNNTALGNLYCALNNISNLDLSSNSSMIFLECSGNNLSSLDVSNGNNVNFNTFNATGNASLTCIQVDDVAWSTANWTNIDAASSFSLNCLVLVNSITVQGQAGATMITTNGGTLQMFANVLPANADDATLTWSVINGTGSASINATGLLTAMTDGTVTVKATANDASSITGVKVITLSNQTVGVGEQAAIQNVSIYPNPVNSQLTIKSEELIEKIMVLNMTGQIIQVEKTSSFSVENLPKGIYVVNVKTTSGSINKRLIKE